ncbi:ribosomal protein L21-like protein [Lasiosphaeria hispida]|uniref:Large ribosomal subunit protein bL21m n=1 Tax=Lasiosphaeria hispida TaxID=260671 RepID=A0AAJ0HUE5_9PEZI|nr:ribosomal protein L21-like protein [Lasiosphaeria hispida]
MSRALLRSVLELRTPVTRLPPSFLLPMRSTPARFFNQTTQIIEPAQTADADAIHATLTAARQQLAKQQQQQQQQQPQSTPKKPRLPTEPSLPTPTGPVSESVRTLLPILAAQPGHYITIHIHGQPYLVTEGDSVRLPFKMPGVEPGDVLRLDCAAAIGSRDFTLQGAPYVDGRLFECRAIVTGTEAEPMRVLIKKKRRCRRKTHIRSKHKYTIMRISELKIRSDVSDL